MSPANTHSHVSRPFLRIALALLLTAVASILSSSAGFAALDCGKNRKPYESAVCNHRDLMLLDAEVDGLWFAYSRVPFLMGANGARRDEEAEFQERRISCGENVACLRRVYRSRIDDLKINLAQAMDNIRREENEGPPAFPSVLPAPVEAIVAGYADQCRALGGTLTGAIRPDMLASDLDRDGKADYVLNPQNLKCSAAATAFCGNGGCQITIASSADGYKQPISVLGGQPTLVQAADGTRVEVWVDRSNCSLTGHDKACWETFAWKDGKVEKSFRARPQE